MTTGDILSPTGDLQNTKSSQIVTLSMECSIFPLEGMCKNRLLSESVWVPDHSAATAFFSQSWDKWASSRYVNLVYERVSPPLSVPVCFLTPLPGVILVSFSPSLLLCKLVTKSYCLSV